MANDHILKLYVMKILRYFKSDRNSKVDKSEQKLLDLVAELEPLMNQHNFKFTKNSTTFSSGGEFSNGFFVNNKIKVGLIYHGDDLGSVNYETKYSNIDHDSIFKHLGIDSEQELLYNTVAFRSYTRSGNISNALFNDLENHILPYIEGTSLEDINTMIRKERTKIGL